MNAPESKKSQVSPAKSKISMLISAILMGNVGLLVWALELAGYSTYAIVLMRGLGGTLFLTIFIISIIQEILKNRDKISDLEREIKKLRKHKIEPSGKGVGK